MTEAPVNSGRNYDGPKVKIRCLSKIWLYAGTSGESSGPRSMHNASCVSTRKNPRGVFKQVRRKLNLVECQTISRKDRNKFVLFRNPQRLYARQEGNTEPLSEDIVRTAWRHVEHVRNCMPPCLYMFKSCMDEGQHSQTFAWE